MPEAVIVATARSPIGRAMKGSLKDIRPDDLSAQVLTDLMSKVPAVTPDPIDDLLMGCGQPAGESGHNIGRATAVLLGWNQVPGVTVNRYCSSSLMTIRMAAHAIKAGEGDCFVAAGAAIEAVWRPGNLITRIGLPATRFFQRRATDRYLVGLTAAPVGNTSCR